MSAVRTRDEIMNRFWEVENEPAAGIIDASTAYERGIRMGWMKALRWTPKPEEAEG